MRTRDSSLHYGANDERDEYDHKRIAESIKEQVCELLESNGAVDASEVEVEVKDCEVTLSGKVSSRAAKREAEACAEEVRGVKDIHNRLTVDNSLGSASQHEQASSSDRSARSRSKAKDS